MSAYPEDGAPPALGYWMATAYVHDAYFKRPPHKDALHVEIVGPDGAPTYWALEPMSAHALVHTLKGHARILPDDPIKALS